MHKLDGKLTFVGRERFRHLPSSRNRSHDNRDRKDWTRRSSLNVLTKFQIDFEASDEQRRTVVRAGLDDALDEHKRLYEGMSDLLLRVAEKLAENVPAGLPNDLNVIYFPQIGFLVTLPKDPETGTALWEGTEEEPWERLFSTDLIVYYKNDTMREMDERFGDVYGDICGLYIYEHC